MRNKICGIILSFSVMLLSFCDPLIAFAVDEGVDVLYDQIKLTNEVAEEITSYNLVESKTINASIPVYSENGTDGVFAAVALYNQDGRLVDIATQNKNVSAGFSTIMLTLYLYKTPQINDYLKVYVWGNYSHSPALDIPYRVICEGEYEELPDKSFKWEAENYAGVSGAINVDSVVVTVQGVPKDIKKIGGFDKNEWLKYENVDFGNGYSKLAVMMGSGTDAASFQVIVGDTVESGTVIGTHSRTTKPTATWTVMDYTHVDISSSIKGVQTVFIKGTSGFGIADIDFFELINDGEDDSSDATNAYVNSNDSGILCSNMSVISAGGFLNEDLHIGTKNGATLEYDFVGKGIDVIARVSPDGGKIKVMVDGELETVVDAYNSQSKKDVIYTVGGMQGDKHRIRLEKLGGNEMAIDGFKVYGGNIKIACVGDSTTNSTTLPGTEYYPQQLNEMLGKGFEVANFGRHSTTVMNKTGSVPYIHTDEYKNSLNFLPDVVVIMLGTNDSLPERWVDKRYFVESYKSIIEEYKNLPSQPRMYINTSPTVQVNSTWGHPDGVISGEMKDMIIQVARETGCEIIDINAVTKNVPDFFYDGLHPNKLGCELFAKEVFKKLPVRKETDTLSIEPVKGGKDAICTIISDDGYWVSSQFFNEAFKEYDFRGTIAYVTDYTVTTEGKDKYGTVEQWRNLLAEGYIDIANHSKSHSGHLTRAWNSALSDTEYEDLLESEINGARSALRDMFPGQKVLGYVLPFNAYDANVIEKAKEEHYAVRGGGNSLNSIEPTEDELFSVKSYDCNGTIPVDKMNGWVDSAIAEGKWIVEMWHGIEGDHIYNPPSKEHIKAHLDHIKSKEEKLWIATYTEAIQYIRERKASRLILLEENDFQISFILSNNMDITLFDYPLSIKVNVPYSWSNVEVFQNGASEVLAVTKNGTDAYVLMDVVPNKSVVTIAKK